MPLSPETYMHQIKQPAAFLPRQTQGTPERKKVYDDGESSRVARAELDPTSRIVIIKKKNVVGQLE